MKKTREKVVIVVLVCVIAGFAVFSYKKQTEYRQVMENQYNMAFFEVVDYVQKVETLLAKTLISKTPEHGAETLTAVWREANLAGAYLAQLPISGEELSNTSKFLNQVSDYSYSLSRKNIYGESLSDDELDNLKILHENSVELENTLNQLSVELNAGRIKWGELTKKGSVKFAQQVSNISKESFDNLNQNLSEYAGLIYDGAFSEHLTTMDKKGLTGNDVNEEQAKEIAKAFIGTERVEELHSNGKSYGDIESYDFSVAFKNGDKNNYGIISVSKRGGHIVLFDYNRDVGAEAIGEDEADKTAKEFLNSKGIANMKETYFLKQSGIITINYAYEQDGVTIYPDLIKVKVALDNGEILGVETKGYLNSHYVRNMKTPAISADDAKKNLNSNLNILMEGFAIIPTKWKTEIFCYEFKGTIDDREFLIYINAENGREEDILVVLDMPGGTLTM